MLDRPRRMCLVLSLIAGIAATGRLGVAGTVTFEVLATPPPLNASSGSFASANGGSDSVGGVTFDDNFLVFGRNYSAGAGGNDLYGVPHGSYAITNGDGSGGTGPDPAGSQGLMITTSQVLTSAYFGANDYGNGSFGADQVTVTAVGASGDLASTSIDLADAQGDPIRTLSRLDTSNFLAFAGQIIGYRLDSEVTTNFAIFGAGGNYIADDFTFGPDVPTSMATPEPASLTSMVECLVGLGCWQARRRFARGR